jgi:uncharacterized repeat protein (TIGR01451 family)
MMSHPNEPPGADAKQAGVNALNNRVPAAAKAVFLKRFWVGIFGEISWRAPRWLAQLLPYVIRHPKPAFAAVFMLLLLGVGGWFGYQAYQNRPKPIEPPRVQVSVAAPIVTDYTQTPLVINPLVVNFSASVAPIALVGKPAKAGIELSPAIAGQWIWNTDKTLQFNPAGDWPVGQKFELKIHPREALTDGVLLAQTTFDFTTAALSASIQSAQFYQDPQDPLKKSAIFGVSFNYPVDPKTFEQSVTLAMLAPDPKNKNQLIAGTAQKFSVTYDPRYLTAFVHSAPLNLSPDNQQMQLTLAKGVMSSRGGEPLSAGLTQTVEIPGLNSLAITDASISLVDNAQFEPEQTLILSTSAAVTAKALNAKVRAWLLPAEGPKGEANYSWSAGMVSEAVLKRSSPLDLAVQPTERDFADVHGFKFNAPTGRLIYVQVNHGLNAFGGYTLAKNAVFVLSVPEYPEMLKLMGQGALLSLNGDHRISVASRNVPGLRVSVARVLPTQMQHLVAFNQGSFAKPELRISPDHLIQRFVKTQALPDADPTKVHYSGIDLSPYLGEGKQRKRGVFLVRVVPWSPDAAENEERFSQYDSGGNSPFDANSYHDESAIGDARLIVVTDLGLLAKKSLDGSYDVFVQSITTGQPVANATVKVIAENGETLLSQATDAAGHVHFPTLAGFKRENKPVMFSVYTTDTTPTSGTTSNGTDFSFLPISRGDRTLNYSRFDVGGASSATSANELSAYGFSDRGLYRPGDEFHVGFIVRSANWQQDISGLPLKIELVDPRGMRAADQAISPNQSGFMQWQYTPSETAPTGAWTVNLYLVHSENNTTLLGSTTVQVKEFEPDQTRVSARLLPAAVGGWVKPQALHALIQAQTLFGTPAAHRRVTATLTLSPAFPAFPSFSGFDFYDPEHAKSGYTETLQEQTTDATGAADFALNLSSFAPATYSLNFYAQVFEPDSGRNVAATASTLVSNADYLIGLKTEADLDYIARDAAQPVQLIAINPELKSIAVAGLRAVILSRQYVSVLTKQNSGVYQYQSKLKEIPVSTQPLTIAAGGSSFALPTQEPGSYALVIESSAGQILNRVDFVVAGAANVSRSLERNAELQLALNKKDYAPGDTIDVAIRAPYTGSGLITIERDKVYAWAWFHADTASSVQHITIPKSFEGNGYINVQFVRDPASSAIYMSPLSYGVVPFSVDVNAHKEPVTLQVPTLIKPGQTLDMTVTTPEPADVVVFAADQGILQVANYALEDPLKFFFRKRMLQVSTNQILDLILPSFAQLTQASTTGGDADSLRAQQLNPFRRKHEKPVAYWSGITQVSGSHTFRYTVPDSFNGELKVMVMAVTPQKIGIAQSQTTVRGDFVLSPNLPVAVAPGDEFDATVNVVNNLKADGASADAKRPIHVAINAGTAFAVVGASEQTLDLAASQSGVARFKLKALSDLGSAPVQFTATSAQAPAQEPARAQRQVEVSVRPSTPFQTDVSVGMVKAGDSVTVAPLRDLFTARSDSHAAISYLPMVMMQGLGAYLENYSNYCTEQTISAATPALIATAQPEFALNSASAARAPEVVSRAIATLRNRQNSEGGFGIWVATPEANPFVSGYAVQFLLLARAAGISVPDDMLVSGLSYLRNLAANDALSSPADLRARAFAIYLLTESGEVTTNLIAAVQQRLQALYPAQWPTDAAAVYLACAYHLMKADTEANQLIKAPIKALSAPRPATLPWTYADYYDPLIFDANSLYLIEKNFPQQAAQLPPDILVRLVHSIAQGRYNTLSAALSMLALANFGGEVKAPMGLSLKQQQGANTPWQSFGHVKGATVTGTIDNTSRAVQFVNDAKAPAPSQAWYALAQSGYDRTPATKAVKEGLEIVRTYTDAAGKPVDQVTLGQTVDVHISLRALGEVAVGDVAVVDILPGGFELVPNPPPTAQPAAPSDAAPQDENAPDGYTQENSDSAGNGAGAADASIDAADSTPPDPLAQPGSNLLVNYVEPREDRVLIYAEANRNVQQYIYRIRATNTGTFTLPPAYAASMYDQSIKAYSPGEGKITVTAPVAPSEPASSEAASSTGLAVAKP